MVRRGRSNNNDLDRWRLWYGPSCDYQIAHRRSPRQPPFPSTSQNAVDNVRHMTDIDMLGGHLMKL